MEDDGRPSHVYKVEVYVDGNLGCEPIFSMLISLPNAEDACDFVTFVWNVCKDLWGQKPRRIEFGYNREHSGLYGQLPHFLDFFEYPLNEDKLEEFIKRWVLYVQHRRPTINGRCWNDDLINAIEIEETRIKESWKEVSKWNS